MLIDAVTEAGGAPGAGAAVYKDGALVWSGSSGLRDVSKELPVTPATSFRLASVSKLVTATIVARAIEDGAIDPNARLAELAPEIDWRDEWHSITPSQLAAHTSGMPHYQAEDAARGAHRFAGPSEALVLIQNRPLLSAPGQRYEYSSWGFVLLSFLAELRTNRPFLELVDEIAPGVVAEHQRGPQASVEYRIGTESTRPAPAHDYSYTWGGGGLRATPKAIAEFGARLLAGELLSRSMLDFIWAPATLADGGIVEDRDSTVGFGWRIGRDGVGRKVAHHAGAAIGARSALVLWPDHGVTASLLTNAEWVSSIESTAQVIAAAFVEPLAEGAACPVSKNRYRGQWNDIEIRGSAQFELKNGICEGLLSMDESMQSWFKNASQGHAKSMRVVALGAQGTLSGAALVTPYGLYQLNSQGSALSGRITTHRLRLVFE